MHGSSNQNKDNMTEILIEEQVESEQSDRKWGATTKLEKSNETVQINITTNSQHGLDKQKNIDRLAQTQPVNQQIQHQKRASTSTGDNVN